VTDHDFLPIPPIESATNPVHSPADLRQRWRALLGELGFGERLLWVGFVGPDRRLYKSMSHVPIGYRPKPGIVEFVMSRLPLVLAGLEPGCTVALLLSGPGGGPITDADRQWASALSDAAKRFDVPLEPMFRANDDVVLPVEPERKAAAGNEATRGIRPAG
jgi:hypothetical protein